MQSNPVFPNVPILLVDGDIVAYRAAAAAEKTKYAVTWAYDEVEFFDGAREAKARAEFLGDGIVWSRKELEPESHALQCLESTMEAVSRRFPEAIIQVYLSGERNFRDQVWRTKRYKGNRTAEKPRHLEAVRQALISRWFAVVSQNQEADDDIGIASGNDTIVVSTDKDLDQIPGWHYNWVKEELYYVTPEDAEKYFWEQVISGDPVDNIPGLPGWGPVKARKYMDEWDTYPMDDSDGFTIKNYVWNLFKDEDFTYDYFTEMCDLVRIKQNVAN